MMDGSWTMLQTKNQRTHGEPDHEADEEDSRPMFVVQSRPIQEEPEVHDDPEYVHRGTSVHGFFLTPLPSCSPQTDRVERLQGACESGDDRALAALFASCASARSLELASYRFANVRSSGHALTRLSHSSAAGVGSHSTAYCC
jgi:hypothetical protein